MQQKITVIASPEEAFLVNTAVDTYAMIDAITAINERTGAICDLLVKSIRASLVKGKLLCSVAWQLQANMDCLTLFIKQYIRGQQFLCSSLIKSAKQKASYIIMYYGATDQVAKSFADVIEPLLAIKQYINTVVAIACYQREQDKDNMEVSLE